MPTMRKLWREFKAFAMGGNMLDLALAFIIGAAFSKLIESLSQNLIMDSVAAVFGQPNFNELNFTIRHHNRPPSSIHVGAFAADLLTFFILAVSLFLVIKAISVVGGRSRVFEERTCPYCLERVTPRALICKVCGQALVAELPPLEEAERRFNEMNARRALPLPPISIPIPVRRRGDARAAAAATGVEETEQGD
jgi:large conductance mechanosensitive channel